MLRPVLYTLATCALLAGVPTGANGQEPEPVQITAGRLADNQGYVLLTFAWRYHSGDDPRWADPAFDDSDWEIVAPQMPPGGLPRGGWSGTGWFRRHLQMAPALQGRPLVIRIATAGATAVFLDGGATVEREGIRILLGGFVILCVLVVLQALLDFGLISPVAGLRIVWVFGMLAFAVAMSLFLARSFGRTSLHLERRLNEVRELSEQVLAQERAAHEQELRRRLLEAENARTAAEIEAARTLQLSMLPAKLPAVAGLETAAVMATASEVGGDYYDFRVAPPRPGGRLAGRAGAGGRHHVRRRPRHLVSRPRSSFRVSITAQEAPS